MISDADRDTAEITTMQAKVVRLLDAHPDAEKVEDISWHHANGVQPGGVYKFPARQIRFGRRRKAREGSHLSLPQFRSTQADSDEG